MKNEPLFSCARAALCGCAFGLGAWAFAHPVVTPEALCGVFAEPAAPAFRVEAAGDVTWQVVNARGERVAAGRGAGRLAPPVPDRGYYELAVRDGTGAVTRVSFVRVPDPQARPLPPADSFHGVDSALSAVAGAFRPWGAAAGVTPYRAVADLMRLAGVRHTRERLDWICLAYRPGEPPPFGRYLAHARMLHERGVALSGLYHNAPPWTRRTTGRDGIPTDLLAAYRFAEAAAAAFGPCADNWEFYNEMEGHSAPEGAWDYVASAKAAYLGHKAGNPQARAMMGALCLTHRSAYDDALFDNDLAYYTDAFNYHTYAPLPQRDAIFAELRAFMARHGIADRAIWITENGFTQEGPAEEKSAAKGRWQHAHAQDLLLAEYYPKSQIDLQMRGVSRGYHFIFGYYHENNGHKDWGVLRADGTVKPVYAAISTLLGVLGAAALEGEVDLGEDARAYQFRQPDGTHTLALWRRSAVDRGAKHVTSTEDPMRAHLLPLPAGVYAVTDFLGARTTARAGAHGLPVVLSRYPQYVRGVPALPLARCPVACGKTLATPPGPRDLTVIVRANLNEEDFTIGDGKACAELRRANARLTLEVWNLSDRPKRGRLAVTGGRLEGLPDEIALPAWGKASYACTCRSDAARKPGVVPLAVDGVFENRPITRFAIPMTDLALTYRNMKCVKLATDDPRHWRRNTSADEYACVWDAREQAIRFDVLWRDPCRDRWFYPYYDLQPGELPEGVEAVVFECKSAQDRVENDFVCAYCMPGFGGSRSSAEGVTYLPPRLGWETRRAVFRDAVRQAGGQPLTSLRFGGNPHGQKLTFWIRNVRLYGKKERTGCGAAD